MSERVEWIDFSKGIGILLVVISHSVAAYARRTGNMAPLHSDFEKIILSFFMPLFYFLSGLFVSHLIKKNLWTVIKTRFKRLMVPYFIWGVIFLIFYGIYSRSIPLSRLMELPIRPIFVLWFVYTLFLCDITFYLFAYFTKNKLYIGLVSIFMFILGEWMNIRFNLHIDSSFYPFTSGLFTNFIYVYLGYLFSNRLLKIKLKKFTLFCMCVICFAGLYGLQTLSFTSITGISIDRFLSGVLGILLIISISLWLGRRRHSFKLVKKLGVMSMEIYLIHKILVEVFSVFFVIFTSNVYLVVIGTTVMTICVCWLAVIVVNKLGVSRILFGSK